MVRVFSLYFTPGSWADAIVIQAVADALNLIILIQVFASITNIGPVSSETDTTVMNIGHLDEIHYVSTVPFNEEQAMANNVICNNHPAQITMVTLERQIIMRQ